MEVGSRLGCAEEDSGFGTEGVLIVGLRRLIIQGRPLQLKRPEGSFR